MANEALISIIIPTHNSAKVVGRAIQSVLKQTYKEFEVIIIDEASNEDVDDIENIINSFQDARLRLFKYRQNTGLPSARNKGIRLSKGTFIAFLDSDDEWHAEKLARQLQLFQESPSTGLVYCGIEFIREEHTLGVRNPVHRGNILKHILCENVVGNATTIMVRRECFDHLGLFDERLTGFGEDWDFFIRLAKVYTVDFNEEPLARYHFHDAHKTFGIMYDPLKGMDDRSYILKKHKDAFDRYPKAYSWVIRRMGVQYLLAGQTNIGRKYFLKAFKLAPLAIPNGIALLLSLFGARLFSSAYHFSARVRRKHHGVALRAQASAAKSKVKDLD